MLLNVMLMLINFLLPSILYTGVEDKVMDAKSPLGTGAVVGLSISATFLIALTVGLGVLCYFWWGRQKKMSDSQQPEAVYEEIPDERLQGTIEMKENNAYGPVIPRGGPVYEVPIN